VAAGVAQAHLWSPQPVLLRRLEVSQHLFKHAGAGGPSRYGHGGDRGRAWLRTRAQPGRARQGCGRAASHVVPPRWPLLGVTDAAACCLGGQRHAVAAHLPHLVRGSHSWLISLSKHQRCCARRRLPDIHHQAILRQSFGAAILQWHLLCACILDEAVLSARCACKPARDTSPLQLRARMRTSQNMPTYLQVQSTSCATLSAEWLTALSGT